MSVFWARLQPYANEPTDVVIERVRMLLGDSLYAIVGTHLLIGTALLVALLSLEPQPGLWLWWLAVITAVGLRALFVLRQRRIGVGPDDFRRVAWTVTAWTGLTGLVWGIGAAVFFDPESSLGVTLITCVLMGMVAGGIGPLAPFFPSFLAFGAASVLPYVGRLLLSGEQLYYLFAAFGIVFLLFSLVISGYLGRWVGEIISLRFENQKLIRRLQRKRREAEQANEAKGHFLIAASHDLRQPLHSLSLAADMLDTEHDEQARADLTRTMRASVESTNNLLTGLLDLSRLDSGAVRANRRNVSLRPLFEHLREVFNPIAADAGIKLHVSPTAAQVHSDPALLDSILCNLIANGIRYTGRGGTVMVLSRWRRDGQRIEVRDNGPGIPPQDRETIFDDFRRLPGSSNDTGLGLGLAIVRRTVDLLDHRLTLQSEVGRGSVFAVAVAAASDARETPDAGPVIDAEAVLHVLLVDPQDELRINMARLLESKGFAVVEARSMEDASRRLRESGSPIDMLIIGGRGEDRLHKGGLASNIGQFFDADIPVLLTTGDTSPELAEYARMNGFEIAYRPVSGDRLTYLIRLMVGDRRSNPGVTAAGESA